MYDFGKISFGQPATYTIEFTNISKDTLTLVNARPGCGCTTPNFKPNEKIDVNILIERLIERKEKVLAFRSDGPYYWIDIGTHADYEKANLNFANLLSSMPYLGKNE